MSQRKRQKWGGFLTQMHFYLVFYTTDICAWIPESPSFNVNVLSGH